jgi:methyl-accepting chemotaxis protein
VRTGSDLVAHAHAALASIIANSDQVLDRIRQVAAAGEEHAAKSAQISETIERISNVTRGTASGTSSIVQAAEHLNHLVEVTQTHVSRFRVGEETAEDSLAPIETPLHHAERDEQPVELSVG